MIKRGKGNKNNKIRTKKRKENQTRFSKVTTKILKHASNNKENPHHHDSLDRLLHLLHTPKSPAGLTSESRPSVNSMKKKSDAHSCGKGSVREMASGYAMKARPGPAMGAGLSPPAACDLV